MIRQLDLQSIGLVLTTLPEVNARKYLTNCFYPDLNCPRMRYQLLPWRKIFHPPTLGSRDMCQEDKLQDSEKLEQPVISSLQSRQGYIVGIGIQLQTFDKRCASSKCLTSNLPFPRSVKTLEFFEIISNLKRKLVPSNILPFVNLKRVSLFKRSGNDIEFFKNLHWMIFK